MERGWSGT